MASYVVRILTHARRGAGTTASVRIFRLTGQDGSAGPFPWMRDGFPTGSTIFTRINTEKPLGPLKELEIGHDSIGDAGTGWLLSGVGVRDTLHSDDETWFPCGRWLGESDAQDGQSGPTRVLLTASFTAKANHGTRHSEKTTLLKSPLSKAITGAFAVPEVTKIRQGKRARVTRREGWAGEDAYFVSEDQTIFGVSDGVSQWTETGVDAGLFARALMEGAARTGSMDAAAANAKQAHVQGSATVAITKIDLKAASCIVQTLGDSRVALVRRGKVVERTIEQEHSFGVPYQLSSDEGRDQPSDCLEYEWDLQSGDTIVAGTDGLFDNVSEEEIARIVSDAAHKTPFDKAAALCQAAFDISQATQGDTPYSRAANEALNLAFSGGKKDDISAIVSIVM